MNWRFTVAVANLQGAIDAIKARSDIPHMHTMALLSAVRAVPSGPLTIDAHGAAAEDGSTGSISITLYGTRAAPALDPATSWPMPRTAAA